MDVKKNCAAVMGRVIFIGFCVQIVLGILWMCNAFAEMHDLGKGIVCVIQILLLGGVLWLLMPKETIVQKLFRVFAVESFPMILQLLVKPDLRVLLVILLLLGWKVCEKRVSLACICVILGIGVGTVLAPEKDLLALSGSRIVWTTLYHDFLVSEDEIEEKIEYSVMAESTLEASGIEKILLPSLRERYPEAEVRAMMKTLMQTAWRIHKKQILKEIVWDEAGYILSPIVLLLQLQHRAYDSYSGLNYRQFLQVAPLLGKYTMRYGCCWFGMALILRILLSVLSGQEKMHGHSAHAAVYAAVTVGGMSAWYTFSTAGRMDYKNVVYILCLWLLWVVDGAAFWKEEAVSDAACTEEK